MYVQDCVAQILLSLGKTEQLVAYSLGRREKCKVVIWPNFVTFLEVFKFFLLGF